MDGTVANTLTSIAGFGNAALEAHPLKNVPRRPLPHIRR